MNTTEHGVTLWHPLKQAVLVLLFLSVLTLLALLGVVGTTSNHASQTGVPTGGLMAPAPGRGGGTDGGLTSIATTNGDIHVGEMAAGTGDVYIGNGG